MTNNEIFAKAIELIKESTDLKETYWEVRKLLEVSEDNYVYSTLLLFMAELDVDTHDEKTPIIDAIRD